MSVDMQNVAELKRWAYETIANAALSSRGEVEVGFIVRKLNEAVGLMPPGRDCTIKELAARILSAAAALLDEDAVSADGPPNKAAWFAVFPWVLKTLAVARIARGQPFDHEKLEAEADSAILAGVQGNRKAPPRQGDLDWVVRKTVLYAQERVA